MSINVISKVIASALQCTNLVSQKIHHPFTRTSKILKHLNIDNKVKATKNNPKVDYSSRGVYISRGAKATLAIAAVISAQGVSPITATNPHLHFEEDHSSMALWDPQIPPPSQMIDQSPASEQPTAEQSIAPMEVDAAPR